MTFYTVSEQPLVAVTLSVLDRYAVRNSARKTAIVIEIFVLLPNVLRQIPPSRLPWRLVSLRTRYPLRPTQLPIQGVPGLSRGWG